MDAATLAWSAGTAALTAVVTGSRAGGQPRGDAAAGPCDDGHEGSLLQCFAAHAFSDAASALCTVNLASYLLFVCTWALSYAGCGALRQEEREQLRLARRTLTVLHPDECRAISVLLEAPLRHLERPEHLLVEGILDIGLDVLLIPSPQKFIYGCLHLLDLYDQARALRY